MVRRTAWQQQSDGGNLEFFTVRSAALVVAASDASEEMKSQADWNDGDIQAALDALPSGGGCIILSDGTFSLSSQLARAIDNVTIVGQGRSTRINLNGSTAVVTAGSQSGWYLGAFDTDAGGVAVGSGSASVVRYWKDGVRTEASSTVKANSGTATILNGNTSVVVTHGLSVTPTLEDISVVLGNDTTSSPATIWITNITSTQFTINSRNDPGSGGLGLGWRAVVL